MSEEVMVSDQPETPSSEPAKEEKETKSATIRPQDHERAVKDMLKFKNESKELKAALAQKEEELQNRARQILETQENFKAAYENEKKLVDQYKQKLSESEQKINLFWDSYYNNEKKNAVLKEAFKAGLRKEAETDIDLLKLDEVAIERTDQGRVMTHGAESFVEKLKQTKPHWFSNKGVANINTGGTNKAEIGDGELTAEKMVEIQRKDPKKFRELWPKYASAEARRSKT